MRYRLSQGSGGMDNVDLHFMALGEQFQTFQRIL